MKKKLKNIPYIYASGGPSLEFATMQISNSVVTSSTFPAFEWL
jgi:hypothetical protein